MNKCDMKLGQKVLFRNGMRGEVGFSLDAEDEKVIIGVNEVKGFSFTIDFKKYSSEMRNIDPNFSLVDAESVLVARNGDGILSENLANLYTGEIKALTLYTNCENEEIFELEGEQLAIDPTASYDVGIVNIADGEYVSVAYWGGSHCVMYPIDSMGYNLRAVAYDILEDFRHGEGYISVLLKAE